MRRLLGFSTLLVLVFAMGPAFAKDKKDKDKDDDSSSDDSSKDDSSKDDDDVDTSDKTTPAGDDFKDDDDSDAPKVERAKEGDSDDTAEPTEGDDLHLENDNGDDLDFDEGEENAQETVKERQPGEDTAQLYRDQQKKCADMSPDEEQIAWEAYLKKYPKSLFRERIEERMEDLSGQMFNERVPGSGFSAKGIDAAKRELNFANPIRFTNVDTRTHANVAIELGFPDWVSIGGDFEYAFLRQLSAHIGLDGKVSGPTLHFGAKYAVLKSARTGTIFTPTLDFDFLTVSSGFPILPHPILAFGQRINVMDGLDLQAQLGAKLDFRAGSAVSYTAGFNAELRPNEVVSAFVETDLAMKYIGDDAVPAPFMQYVATFGMRFRLAKPKTEQGDGRVTAGLAASAPYAYRYWGDYTGMAHIMGDFYFKSPTK